METFKIVELEDFNCAAGHIYSVSIDESETTIFEMFLQENYDKYRNELEEIAHKLNIMAGITGFTDTFFKMNEGKPGDGICAVTDLKGKLRLYCIRFGNILLILGGGGRKTTRTYQEGPKLYSEIQLLQKVSEALSKAIKEKDIRIESDGSLGGNLIIENDN